MKIEKYGKADALGYGLLAKEDWTKPCFVQLVRVEAKSANTAKVFAKTIDAFGRQTVAKAEGEGPGSVRDMFLKSKVPMRTPDAAIPQYNLYNVYVVYDGDTHSWREYFTGIELVVASLSKVNNRELNIGNHTPGLVIDVGASISGIYDTVAITEPVIYDAIAFSESIKQLSRDDIRKRASDLFEIKSNAEKWGEAFDHAVKDVKNERNNAEKNITTIENDLANGFGQFANWGKRQEESRNQSFTTRQTNRQEARANSNVTAETRHQWRINERCAYCGGTLVGGSIIKNYKTCRNCGRINR